MIGGIHLDGKKEATLISWAIRRSHPPAKVYIPLLQCEGQDTMPCVQPGARVRVGEKIAEPQSPSSVALHASVSGEVTAIGPFPHPLLGESQAIEIHSDGRDEKISVIGLERPGWNQLSPEEIGLILQDLGVVELSDGMAPVHSGRYPGQARGIWSSTCPGLQAPGGWRPEGSSLDTPLAKPHHARTHTLILNGCESEPYLTSDQVLMMSHPLEILKGAEILRRFFAADRVIIALEDNKREVAELLKSKIYFLKWKHVEVKTVPSLYPQEAAIPLTRQLLQTDLASLFLNRGAGACVFNVATAFAAYEAVVLQKPLYERVVTVGGECVVEPKNLWVRLGTSFEDALKTCRGLLREPQKVLMNGPMKGIAQESLRVPVMKATRAVLALPKEITSQEEVQPCIRCGLCVEACPVEISPAMITLAAEKDLFDLAGKWGAEFCIECGNCSYVCPAKRPMIELIHHARCYLDGHNKTLSPMGDFKKSQTVMFENLQKKKRGMAEINT